MKVKFFFFVAVKAIRPGIRFMDKKAILYLTPMAPKRIPKKGRVHSKRVFTFETPLISWIAHPPSKGSGPYSRYGRIWQVPPL